MRRSFVVLAFFACEGSLTFAQITEVRAMPPIVEIHIDPNGNLGTVSPQVFGTFIEPIDDSINNGVTAEILVNGSLEAGLWNHAMLEQIYRDQPELIESSNSTGIPIPWEPLNPAAGNRYELHVGDAANSWQSLEILGTPDQSTGIAQQIYLPVPRTFDYVATLYARHISGPAEVSVSLRQKGSDKVLARTEVQVTAPEWRKYTAHLKLTPGSVRKLEPVKFALSVEGTEQLEVDQISLTPSDASGTFDPSVLKMFDAMHMTEIRLGGNFSSYYHWRDGIGPLDKRVVMKNIAWGIPEYNNFGTDEFLDLCRRLDVEPQFDLNLGSGTPEEAADWVKYIRERYQGPLIVELGNELYGKWQVGYPTINQIAERTLKFSEAVKPLIGNATLMATGAVPNNFERWNQAQLTNPPGTFDLLTMHFITGTNHVRLPQSDPDFMAQAAYAVPFAIGAEFDRMQAQVDRVKGYRATHFAVTEWLFNSKGSGERNFTNESPSSKNEGGAVVIASTFNTYFRHNQEIKLVDMTGLMEFAGVWKRREQVFGTPAYYVFQMYSSAKGETVIPVESDSGSYSVRNGTVGDSEIDDVPYVDVVATRNADGKTLTVFCVNRSITRDVDARIHLGSFKSKNSAKVKQISAISRYVMNDEVEPHRVVPQLSSITLRGSGPASVTLPHESVTVIQFQAK